MKEVRDMVILVTIIVLFAGFSLLFCLAILCQQYLELKKARKEIFKYIENYRSRLGNRNRFVVTVDTLREIFQEYDDSVLKKIWCELVDKHIIDRDQMDNEWCIR